MVGTQTLAPDSIITVSGVIVSLAPSATTVVIGASTIELEPLVGITVSPEQSAAITFDGLTVTANSQSEYILEGHTIIPGGSAITLSNDLVSLAPSAAAVVVVGNSTIPQKPLPAFSALPEVITVAGLTVTADSQSDFIIGNQTLTPGGPEITVSGTPVSLATGGTAVIIGTLMEAISTPSSPGLAGLIISGLASMAPRPSPTESLEAPFKGSSSELELSAWGMAGVFGYLGVVHATVKGSR